MTLNVPGLGTAYRVLIERALNHRINSVTSAGQTLIEVPFADDPIDAELNETTLVQNRIAAFKELAKGATQAQNELKRTFTTKKGNHYAGAAASTTSPPFQKVRSAMSALDDLDETVEVLYRGMRAFVHEVEHITAKHWAEKAYKAGWNAAKGQLDTTPDATRDTNATNYANNPPGGFQLVHSTY